MKNVETENKAKQQTRIVIYIPHFTSYILHS
jgi:hypothetical protein